MERGCWPVLRSAILGSWHACHNSRPSRQDSAVAGISQNCPVTRVILMIPSHYLCHTDDSVTFDQISLCVHIKWETSYLIFFYYLFVPDRSARPARLCVHLAFLRLSSFRTVQIIHSVTLLLIDVCCWRQIHIHFSHRWGAPDLPAFQLYSLVWWWKIGVFDSFMYH